MVRSCAFVRVMNEVLRLVLTLGRPARPSDATLACVAVSAEGRRTPGFA